MLLGDRRHRRRAAAWSPDPGRMSCGVPGSLVGRENRTVHLAIHSFHPLESPAARLLGSGHPLVRALDWRVLLHVAALVVGALLISSLAFVARGADWATAVAVSAGVVEAVTCLGLMLAAAEIRGVVLVLLVEGRERLPLREVQRERARLLDTRRRRREARWLERVASGTELGFGLPGRAPPLISPSVAARARGELLRVAAAISRDQAGVAGLALLQLLATEPWSPLYGDDPRALQEALARVRFLAST